MGEIRVSAAGLAIFFAPWLAAQTFEVASVKTSQSQHAMADTTPGRLTIDGSLDYIVKWAYDVRNFLFQAPEWTGNTRYHIAAKSSGPAAAKDLKVMLQALLAERFKLAYHRESKEFMVYALVTAKDGPKLQPSQSHDATYTNIENKRLGSGGTLLNVSMAEFAGFLNGACPDPIVDLTGLKERYDLKLDISGYLQGIQPGDLPVILSEALRKQLGLDLIHRKIPLDVFVVDHAEQPAADN